MRFEKEIAAEQQRFLDRYEEAAAELRRVPGVLSVGVGARERRGEIVQELAFRVYVSEKLDESVLPEAHRVPPEVCGLPTDVLVRPDIDEMQFSPAGAAAIVPNWDGTKYRPLKGGSQLRTERFEGDNKRGMGTLGCLATMADGTMVALTAQHVACAGSAYAVGAGPAAGMAGGSGGGGVSFACVGVKVGQPRHITCCCCCTFNEIGTVLRAEKTAELDCATVKLDADIAKEVRDHGTLAEVADIGALAGVAPAVLLSEVRKRGAATGLTRGTVVDVAFEGNQILINPLPGFPRFAYYGDSGAVVVDNADKVVGLLWGADRATGNRGVANHIAPVVVAMGINIATCAHAVLGPGNVPGLSEYRYQMDVPAAAVVTGIVWTVNKPTASIVGPADQRDVKIRFTNANADWIRIRADFTINGTQACAQKQVALVRVAVGPAAFTNPGRPTSSVAGAEAFLVDPPAAPAVPTWITTHDPGSDCAAFTYNGAIQAAEPRRMVLSNGAGVGAGFEAKTRVTLTSPAQQPNAHHQIQVGFIQHASDAGSSTYLPAGTRTVASLAPWGLDWLITPCTPVVGSDEWPWYHPNSREQGVGLSPSVHDLAMTDSPSSTMPAQHDPNHPGPGSLNAINTATETLSFEVRIGARTLDVDLDAHKHYFEETRSTWTAVFAWPPFPGVSLVTFGPAWVVPPAPSEISINIVPFITLFSTPFQRWIPS